MKNLKTLFQVSVIASSAAFLSACFAFFPSEVCPQEEVYIEIDEKTAAAMDEERARREAAASASKYK